MALLLSSGWLTRVPSRFWKAGAWVSVALIALLAETGNGNSSFQWGYPLTAAAVVIAALVTTPPAALAAVLGSRPAVWIGRRSYGLYVWSYPIYYGLPWPKGFTGWPRDITEIGLSFVVAAVSYRFLELPFLRLKGRLHPSRRAAAAASVQ